MRRILLLLLLGIIPLFICKAVSQPFDHWLPKSTSPSLTPSQTQSPKITFNPYPSPTIKSKTATAIPEEPFSVIYHPDSLLYVGDQVSLEVIAPPDGDLQDSRVEVVVTQPISQTLQPAKFSHFGLGKRLEANLTWAWDTSRLSPGDYSLNFSVLPHGAVWTETLTLHPDAMLPPNEDGAHWVTDESDCCLVYYITQTASERDISSLLEMLDKQAAEVSRKMGAAFDPPVSVAFIPRLLGHGGFASQEITVSYLDRNYTGNATEMIVHHEMTHILDGQLGGDLRPIMLIEGVALYISEGHFKPEPLLPRAAVMAHNQQYIPLKELIDDFYNSQHEIGYLEAGALVEFMTETWGWEGFSSFYRDIHPVPDDGLQSAAVELALQKHFNISLDILEQRFLEALDSQSVSPEHVQDVHLTIDFYNTVRRYQQMCDPSAYFLTAWILDGNEMRQRGITADYMRHPAAAHNLTLETMLQAAGNHLQRANYGEAEHLIGAVNLALDALERDENLPFTGSSLAVDYHAIVENLLAHGYQPQRVDILNDHAYCWATIADQQLHEILFIRNGNYWEFQEE
ncbi:MAG: hypothetical protein JW908_11020 [Anaerolineales bacterium]|nr:hypothetical protein [Anaerolineales bacterium]